jgi:alkylated DNA repair dioxygenase AlkB
MLISQKKEADLLWTHCTQELSLVHEPTGQLFGKPITMHRDVGFFSDTSMGYRYSGQIMKAQPLTTSLTDLLLRIQKDIEGSKFNAWLVNYYEDGTKSIGAHSDDETSLAPNGCVAAISL